jgi:hypothetical protein
MASASRASVAEGFRTALDLFETGVAMKRQSLRRKHPDASDEDIEQRLQQWLLHRPGAEHGDSPGRRVDLADLTLPT